MRSTIFVAAVFVAGVTTTTRLTADTPPPSDTLRTVGVPFVKAHCIKCHGPDKQAGDVRLDDLSTDMARDGTRWLAVRDQVRDGLMPPAKSPQPDAAQAKAVVTALTVASGDVAARLPNQGNLIPHDLLFGKPAAVAGASPARMWRISPAAYANMIDEWVRGKGTPPSTSQPFTLMDDRGFSDFSGLYSVDEPTTEILLRNALAIVKAQTEKELTVKYQVRENPKEKAFTWASKQVPNPNAVPEYRKLMDPAVKPTTAQVEAVVRMQYRMAICRTPSADEMTRYLALYKKCEAEADSPAAIQTVLQAVLLKTDAIYRSELGTGKADGTGRRMLAPAELARTISLTLGNRVDDELMQAASKGELATREQVAAQVTRMLTEPKVDRSRIMGFFREYFEYHRAPDVFKDPPKYTNEPIEPGKKKPRGIAYVPKPLVDDTDRLVRTIVGADKDVFRELLTTTKTFVNYTTKDDEKAGKKNIPTRAFKPNYFNDVSEPYGVERHYDFRGLAADWPEVQPIQVKPDTRIGVLMQPSWLIAWSGNFDNEPVRRGRWVRERLLGGTVPDLPIGVEAKVPDDPHRTYRDRLTITRAAQCWKCHQRMDELGLPFEQFDHFGVFRTTETVRDPEATAKNVDKKGKSLGPVTKEVSLNTAGTIAFSGDPALDGPVKDPREMIRKIANSDLARQVFVRHAFRYYLGRNESMADAKTLQDVDAAYVKGGGSFKALVTSLLTSDAFLYRTASPVTSNGDSR